MLIGLFLDHVSYPPTLFRIPRTKEYVILEKSVSLMREYYMKLSTYRIVFTVVSTLVL